MTPKTEKAPLDVGADQPYGRVHAALAVCTLAAIVAAATLAAAVAAEGFDRWNGVGAPGVRGPGELEYLAAIRLAAFLIAFQAASLFAALVAIAAFRRPGAALAPLGSPTGGVAAMAKYVLALLTSAALYGAMVYLVDRDAIANDVRPFAGMIRTGAWPLLALVAVVGAPIAEEVMFRGFAFGVLSKSPVGPIGAAIATAALWAVLHASYSIYGLAAIFLIGLYLAWLRHETGSLWPPIVCHGLYNGLIVAVLALAPEFALEGH
ncbi:MAG: lysostaphin resistance A-like protein [Hyphomicrobium sp.]